MVEKLIPKYDFVKNWSEDQLRDFITTPSGLPHRLTTPEIGTVIDDAMRSIEKENKRLKDILPKNFARPELDKRRLGEVVDLFTNIQMIEHGSSKDILGRTYEYLSLIHILSRQDTRTSRIGKEITSGSLQDMLAPTA